MTPAEFAVKYRPQANSVSVGTGIDSLVLLAQWGVETGWGNQINNQNNLGNIRDAPGSFAQLPTLDAFCQLAIATWHNGYYAAVLASVGPVAQIVAIGESPWDAGHYDSGGGPGSSLKTAYNLIGGVEDDMLTSEQGDDIIVNAWRTYRLIGGLGNPPVNDVLSDGSTVESHLDPLSPSIADVMRAIAQLDTKVSGDSTTIGILKVDIQQFVLPILTQLETDIKAAGSGAVDPSIAASLDELKKHLGVGTP